MKSYPTLTSLFDSASYSEGVKKGAVMTHAQGGYTLTRPRYTRPPPLTYEFAYPAMSNADKLALENFHRLDVRGGSDMFAWTRPTDGVTRYVRFVEDDGMTFKAIHHRKNGGSLEIWWRVMVKLEDL
ncbi:hypothetical protein [Roseomonas genomospecies 6]|uniref:Uncharacterized protein n=1 Tax=Roseomonas genomospecies 6 TaxID=214106 RepID=A0A9W7KQZ6_9PROT|nr:hypothetical protein [Roseomonas genomospecies 6]KAA0677787.1 hypothetical protein DS843_21955 [Roseomonas genomospecies 6]